jgi:hypothetical protein
MSRNPELRADSPDLKAARRVELAVLAAVIDSLPRLLSDEELTETLTETVRTPPSNPRVGGGRFGGPNQLALGADGRDSAVGGDGSGALIVANLTLNRWAVSDRRSVCY